MKGVDVFAFLYVFVVVVVFCFIYYCIGLSGPWKELIGLTEHQNPRGVLSSSQYCGGATKFSRYTMDLNGSENHSI